ncbi:MAG TPA: hypothetical protein GXZ90_06585 [Clostridiales bacterium]|nr:hypothetical protein [Clostridiales bacterium]
MKRILLIISISMICLALNGCKKIAPASMPDEIERNTLFIQKDHIVELAIVENFDKDHYSITELQEFAQNQIDSYNTKLNKKVVILTDTKEYKGKAILKLKFKSLIEYADYQKVDADVFQIATANQEQLDSLPETFKTTKKKKDIAKEDIIKNQDLNFIILNDAYDFIIENDILYYSANAKLINKNKIETLEGQATIIVYK